MKRLFLTLSFIIYHLSFSHIVAQIVNIEPVCVETPVGHAPRLPYQLWVTDAKGHTKDMVERATNQMKTILKPKF